MSEIKNDHYYSKEPKSKLMIKETTIHLKNGHRYQLKSPSGVFSFGKPNRATECLLNNILINGKEFLDLGCGYGAVGIICAKENPFLHLHMSDINERAVRFAKENALNYNLDVEIRSGNLFDPWQNYSFDMIVFNPPLAAGKEVWLEAVKKSHEHLKESGTIQIVAYHNKGGKRIMQYMKTIFSNVRTLVKSGGIRVYLSERLKQ
ncbi:MAG: class I SAM-dependent methyltransferase [bacterium]